MYLLHYLSALKDGYKAAISRLLKVPATTIDAKFELPTFSSISNADEYNNALYQLYTTLYALHAEILNIDLQTERALANSSENITRVKLALEDLEAKILETRELAAIKASYTDTIFETFNAQTTPETDPKFYKHNAIPKAFIDTTDSLLKLPINGEFVNVLTQTSAAPSNVFLDRVFGTPIGTGNDVNRAFDKTTLSYWCEVIHGQEPLYATRSGVPWLPTTYTGGAACRIRVDFEHTTQISELDIRPYGDHPQNLIGVGYTTELVNRLTDSGFMDWENTWVFTTRSYGTTGNASYEVLTNEGPENETIVHITTAAASGAGHIVHKEFSISADTGIELTALLKTVGDTPVELCMSFYTSGASGDIGYLVPIKDVVETVKLEGLGWTKVVLTFDAPPMTNAAKIRIGLPPNHERVAHLYICNPRVEQITTHHMSALLDKRTTVLLPAPLAAKRLYLTFSQEHYDYKSYILNKEEAGLSWERLLRKRYIDPIILSWDRKVRRNVPTKLYTTPEFRNSEVMRPLVGTYQTLVSDLEKLAKGEEVKVEGYEYILGAFEIYLRHREYAAQGRFVSKPIKVGGEIREVALRATEVQKGTNIKYTITVNENDPPENGKKILNATTSVQDLSSYPDPPDTLDYMYTENNPWVNNGHGIWPYFGNAAEGLNNGSWLPPDDLLGIRREYTQFFALMAGVSEGDFVQYEFPAPVDLRGAIYLTLKMWYGQRTEYGDAVVAPAPLKELKLKVELLDSTGAIKISEPITLEVSANSRALAFPATEYSIKLIKVAADDRRDISFIRLVVDNKPDEGLIYSGNLEDWAHVVRAVVGLSELKVIPGEGASSNIRFIPADESELFPYTTANDFIVPTKHIKEIVQGTDRYGRVALREYPYINKTKITSLIATLSENTAGRIVPFDPNALNPQYLSSTNTISTTAGYRPILVTLRFKNTDIIARPDVLGKPDPGDIGFIEHELLEIADVEQNTFTGLETVTSSDTTSKTIATQTVTKRNIVTYETRLKPLVSDKYGIPIQCWFRKHGDTALEAIDANYIKVNAKDGLITISSPEPNNTDIYQVVCSYYYVRGENSLRESFIFPDTAEIESHNTTDLTVQAYPITRNMTDYMTGKIPQLKKANLDPMSSEYYPVFEYYMHPNGYLVFADSFHTYSDQPAELEVEYDTLAISPRLTIDITRPASSSITPAVDKYTLLLNVRRG